jgi:hypothetical protein
MEISRQVKEWMDKGLDSDDAIGVRGCGIEQFLEDIEDGGIKGTIGIVDARLEGVYFYPYYEKVPQQDANTYELQAKNPMSDQINRNMRSYSSVGAFICYCSSQDVLLNEDQFEDLYDKVEKGFDIPELVKEQIFDKTRKLANKTHKEISNIVHKGFERKGVQIAFNDSVYSFNTNIDDPSEGVIFAKSRPCCKPGYGERLDLQHISGIKIYTERERDEFLQKLPKIQDFCKGTVLV